MSSLGNQGQSLAIPGVNPPAARQQLLPQNLQNNTTAVQSSANLPPALSSIAGLSQSNISSVSQTSNLQNMPGISQNSVSNSVGQGAVPDIYANAQRQIPGRQHQQQMISQQQQQSQNQLIYQQQFQQQLLKQKLQHSSLLQPHMQQQQQQQSLLQPTQLQSSQQSLMQMSSGLQSGQSTIQQTQPTTMQSAAQPGLQQNQLNSIQQSVPSLLQQHPQSVSRQQQQAQPSIHQQTPSLQQQPTPVPQQSNLPLQQQQQQIMGQQANISNIQQAQLLGQQNSIQDMQQSQQQRVPVQQNSLLVMQQPQQMLNQQSISLHQQQQLGPQSSLSGLQQQQHQQHQLLGSLPNVSNLQPHQRSMHILQQPKMVPQQQQQTQQTPLVLLQPQGQQSQHQSSQQQLISQFQSQPAQLQQQLAIQQQPSSLQQRLQSPGALLPTQNAIEQQKQFIQAQRVLPEVSSSTPVDSTAQTGHAGVADLQEEIYQKIKSLREMYLADINELYQRISLKFQQHDALMPPAKPSEQYEKMKNYKTILERTLAFLQLPKNKIPPGFKERIPLYEKQILNLLANKKRGIPSQSQGQQQFQHPGGPAHSMPQQQPSLVSQLQQHDNHQNQVQQMNLQGSASSMQPSSVTGVQHVSMPLPTNFGVQTTQQNMTNALQPAANLDSVQGSSYNSLQQGAMGSMQQSGAGSVPNTLNAPQQTNANTLSNSSTNTLQPNASLVQPSSNTVQQQYLKQQQQDQQQQLMQSQQMKQQLQQRHLQQQMLHQQQKQQLMQSQPSLQQQLHQQQKQQPAQMPAHQMPQLHQTNEPNESKVRPGLGIKPGLYQQHYSAGQRPGYYHQLKPGASFPISSPQNLQSSSPQISHHSSPQIDQHNSLPSQVKGGTPLQSANSPFVPSPSTPLAPSPIPVDSEKQLSGLSSVTNSGHVGHQQSALAPPQTQSLAVGTPGISASPFLAEYTSPEGNQANVPSVVPGKTSASERPLERLIKVVKSSTPKALSSAVSDIESVVSMTDRIAGSAPGNGSRAAVGEDLVAMTKCRLQARNFISQDGSATTKKMKRNTSAMPLNNVPSAGSVNDSFKQSYGLDASELESTATSHVKRQKIEVNHALLEEIREINQQLIDTVVNISEEDADSIAAASDGEGTVIKCSFNAVALSPSLKSQFASSQISPILPLRLLVPANYPKCSPVLLDKLPDESSGESDDLSVKAKSRFSISLRGLSQPMSIGDMASTWDACARKVIAEYAQQTGGGSFSSRYGAWENCVGA